MTLPPTQFAVAQFKVERLSARGLWAVTSPNVNDVGLLFLRAQEFYESSNPAFVGSAFTIAEFIKWYSENISEAKTFSYLDDFQGYNLPGDVVDRFLGIPLADPNPHDMLFARIAQAVRVLSHGRYYMVGAADGKSAHMNHEIAHGMWALVPEYQKAARGLVAALPAEDRDKIVVVMRAEGYSPSVADDEINAYFATGLLTSLEDYEHLRAPFMKLFYRHKRSFLAKKPRAKRPAETKIPAV